MLCTLGTSVDTSASLMSAGMDSLAGVLIVQALSLESGVEISPTVLFDHPTLDSVTSFVSSAMAVSSTMILEGANLREQSSVAMMLDQQRRETDVGGIQAWSF